MSNILRKVSGVLLISVQIVTHLAFDRPRGHQGESDGLVYQGCKLFFKKNLLYIM